MAFDYDQLKFLDGRSVLVRPEDFQSQNSVGKRGSLQVVRDASAPGGFRLEIALELPEMSDMGGEHGHTGRIPIPAEAIEPMLLTEFNGAFTYTQPSLGGPRPSAD